MAQEISPLSAVSQTTIAGEDTYPSPAAAPRRPLKDGWGFVLGSQVAPACIFILIVYAKVIDLLAFLNAPAAAIAWPVRTAGAGYRLAVIAFFALAALLFVVRMRPVKKTAGWLPAATAVAGAFVLSFIALGDTSHASVPQTALSGLLVLAGTAFATGSLWILGRSFSILPEARRLVRRGPYRYVRHPAYLGEIVAGAGMAVQAATIWGWLVFGFFLVLQARRILYEESVLAQAFPEYEQYKQTTARLIPGVL